MAEDVGVRYRRHFRRDRGGDLTQAQAVDPTRGGVGTVMIRSGPAGTSSPSAIASPALARSSHRGRNRSKGATPTP